MKKASVYQQKIYDFITEGQGNAVVSAVAGSGKTTTLINSLELIPSNLQVLFLAFNKSIATELKERVPEGSKNIEVKTVHSYGYSSLLKVFDTQIDGNKYRKLLNNIVKYHQTDNLKTLLKEYSLGGKEIALVNAFKFEDSESETIEDKTGYFNRVLTLCDLGRLNLINLSDKDKAIDSLYELSKKHGVEIINGECYRAYLLILIGVSLTMIGDFTDMVFMPNYYSISTPQYDIVFIDECQDLNACQRNLMIKAIKPNVGRFIAVGDPSQAIYGFSGADSESFNKLLDIPNTVKLPLSVCYRCGSDIIDLAKNIMPSLEASPSAKKGIINYDDSWKNIKINDMVLCRNTMPLVSLCLKFLSQGKKASVMGTDIGSNLINMVESCRRKTEEFSIENIFARIYREKDKIVNNIIIKEKITKEDALNTSTVSSLSDKILTLEVLSEGCFVGDDLIQKLKNIFSDNSDGIILSTIHKSKGLEADNVFIIHEELMPSKYAKKDWEMVQEQNLIYVAYTRAKSHLGFVKDFNAYDDVQTKENQKIDLKESNYVGEQGCKLAIRLTVVDLKMMNTSWGDTNLYEMVDDKGNLFNKFGIIPERFLVSNHQTIEIGSVIEFNATIKAHKEFKGVKTNVISTISKI